MNMNKWINELKINYTADEHPTKKKTNKLSYLPNKKIWLYTN